MNKEFETIVEQIKADKQPRKITPRLLFNAFGYVRRTPGNCEVVDNFLNNNSLMVTPRYNEVWIDKEISLEHKPFAKTVIPIDPIRRIKGNRGRFLDQGLSVASQSPDPLLM